MIRNTIIVLALYFFSMPDSSLAAETETFNYRVTLASQTCTTGYSDECKRSFAAISEEDSRKEKLKTYDTDTLLAFADTVYRTNIFAPDKSKITRLADTLAELESRGKQTDSLVKRTYTVYLKARDFAAARAFQKAHTAIIKNPPPDIIYKDERKASSFKVFEVGVSSRELAVNALPIKDGSSLVICTDPDFTYTEEILKALASDTELSKHFDKIYLITDYFEPEKVLTWNKKHNISCSIAYSQEDWQGVDFLRMPGFYIYKDGKIIHSVIGFHNDPAVPIRDWLRARKWMTFAVPTDQQSPDPDPKHFDAEVARLKGEIAKISAEPSDVETVKKYLQAMVVLDQYVRKQYAVLQDKKFSATQIKAFNKTWSGIDAENTERLKKLLKEYGWFKISQFGQLADRNAWLLVQHADQDSKFQEETLTVLEKLYPLGETSRSNFAYLYDRVAVAGGGEHRKEQRYGTQGSCVGQGVWEPLPIENRDGVDARRKEVGLDPLSEYINSFKNICGKSE